MNDPTNAANRQVYDRLRPNERRIVEFSEDDCAPMVEALRAQGFRDVEAKLYRRVRTIPTEAYIGLIRTYSDHYVLELELKRRFEEEMREEERQRREAMRRSAGNDFAGALGSFHRQRVAAVHLFKQFTNGGLGHHRAVTSLKIQTVIWMDEE